ncbi:MAG: hypothetical protein NZZ60_02880 [Bacteroidia bacterium]|nr:hypothetical protein [Bacteroidia bacterium]MCX7651457.1 hypothetical protein [Bacteroidia bacterium]MDW8416788.1 hypothetical protein [Bacteroidia bacterium]
MPVALLWWGVIWMQNVIAELTLDRKQPRPIYTEYVQADGGIVTLSHKTITSVRTFTLHKYNAELRHEWSQDIFEQTLGEEPLHLAVIENQIWTFTQRSEGQKRYIYGYLLSTEGKVLFRQKLLFTVESASRTSKIELKYAPNRKYACLSFSVRVASDSADRIRFFLVGPDTAYAGEWILPYREKELEIRRAIQPSHEGHLFALGAVKSSESPYPKYFLFRYVPEANITLSVPLEVENLYLIEPTFRIEKGGGARIAAFYSLKRGSEQVQGILFARVESSGFFLSGIQKTPLPTEVLQRFLSERQIARGRGIPDLYLDHLIPRADGGVLLIGEQFYIVTTTFRDFYGFWYTQDNYHYEDIVIFAIDSLGNLEWFRIIPKSQTGTMDTELSYALLVGGQKIYFLYRSYTRGMGTQVFLVTLDEKGNLSAPRPFISGFRSSDAFYRKLARQLNNTEGLIAYTRERAGQFVLARIELE